MSHLTRFLDERIQGTPPWIVNNVRVTSPRSLAKALGIQLERRSKLTPLWDGRSINTTELAPEHVVHEIGHWLLAGPWRRTLPNFGLGPSSHGGTCVPTHLPWEKRRHEERMVVLIQAAAGVLMGLLTLEGVPMSVVPRWPEKQLKAAHKELVERNVLGDEHTKVVTEICTRAAIAARKEQQKGR